MMKELLIYCSEKYELWVSEKYRGLVKSILLYVLLGLPAILIVFIVPPVFQKILVTHYNKGQAHQHVSQEKISKTQERLLTEIQKIEKKLETRIPKIHYLVINTSQNEFSLYKGNELIRTDKCSTGSYVLLKNGDDQQWMFKTPKGEFKIQYKNTSPVWKKPDWAFVEEGLPVPTANHSSRFEYGVLGDYSLSLGQGYLIHGTLYQRFLGLPVTHGCVRLNDENLELVYKSLRLGSKVYIF